MKNLRNIFLFALLAALGSSVMTDVYAQNGIQTETRTVQPFRKIAVSGAYTVYITQGSTSEVKIEADKGMLEVTETVTKDGVLQIRTSDSGKGLWRNFKKNFDKPVMNVYVTAPKVESVSLSGSGSVVTKTPLTTDNLTVALDGTGKMDLEFTAKNVTTDLSGSGKITLKGFAETLVMNAKGSGEIYAYDTDAEKGVVNGSGSTKCTIDASKDLIVNLKNYAQVSYRGEPASIVTTTKNKATVNQIK